MLQVDNETTEKKALNVYLVTLKTLKQHQLTLLVDSDYIQHSARFYYCNYYF